MPKRTREEKIITELRRKLREQAPPQSKVQVSQAQPAISTISLPSEPERPNEPAIVTPVRVSETRTFLKGDLVKLGLIALGTVGFEAIISYLILSGVLKPLGIT
jgi:hypothetical protein